MEDDESDDESTLLEEEKRQGKVDYKSEIAELEVNFYFSSISWPFFYYLYAILTP